MLYSFTQFARECFAESFLFSVFFVFFFFVINNSFSSFLFQNLSCNNLGPEGAKYLKHALRSNCFLLKLNVASKYMYIYWNFDISKKNLASDPAVISTYRHNMTESLLTVTLRQLQIRAQLFKANDVVS